MQLLSTLHAVVQPALAMNEYSASIEQRGLPCGCDREPLLGKYSNELWGSFGLGQRTHRSSASLFAMSDINFHCIRNLSPAIAAESTVADGCQQQYTSQSTTATL